MPKILVTGGAGYIGSTTAYVLKQRGFEVGLSTTFPADMSIMSATFLSIN